MVFIQFLLALKMLQLMVMAFLLIISCQLFYLRLGTMMYLVVYLLLVREFYRIMNLNLGINLLKVLLIILEPIISFVQTMNLLMELELLLELLISFIYRLN